MKSLEEREKRERELREAVDKAVDKADRIIMDASDGSNEENNWLTAEVARIFSEKVLIALQGELIRREMT